MNLSNLNIIGYARALAKRKSARGEVVTSCWLEFELEQIPGVSMLGAMEAVQNYMKEFMEGGAK